MKIEFSSYSLNPRSFLNRLREIEPVHGVLLRVTFDQNCTGFSALQPWPLLGDPSLDSLIENLTEAADHPLVRSALYWARRDGEARLQSKPLLPELPEIKSHRLISDPADINGSENFKLKMGRNLASETEALLSFINKSSRINVRWRLDFNEALSCEEFERWLIGFGSQALSAIDYIEDPCPFEAKKWTELQCKYAVNLAYDRATIKSGSIDAARVRVFSPSRQAEVNSPAEQRIVFASNMDHPLMQAAALVGAREFYARYPEKIEICGLESYRQFHPVPGFEWPSEKLEAGLGFSRSLNELKWQRLL